MQTLKNKVRGQGRGTSYCRGFTLMELIIVIAIISILAGISMPALRRARAMAREASAKAMIASLGMALSMYETDFGAFPTDGDTDGTLTSGYTTTTYEAENPVIIQLLTGEDAAGNTLPCPYHEYLYRNPDWHGPYFEVRREDVGPVGSLLAGWLLDPWGNPYVIVFDRDNVAGTGPPFHNELGIDIFSVGPDGTTSAGDATYLTWIDAESDGGEDDDINSW